MSRAMAGCAVLYLLFAFAVVLSWSFKPLEAVIPQALVKFIYPIDKSDLDPLRLVHFLAIAVLVAKFVPRDWKGLTTPILRSAVRCGENSLEIYCTGVVLALAAHALLVQVSAGIAMQVTVSAGGVLAMIAIATVLTRLKVESRSEPRLF